jgi:hypothetical protein
MGEYRSICSFILVFLLVACTSGEDPYRFYNWNVTYGDIYPLGIKQRGILINGQFPGPQIESVTNDNLIISVFNSLDEPFLLSWLVLFSFPLFFFPPCGFVLCAAFKFVLYFYSRSVYIYIFFPLSLVTIIRRNRSSEIEKVNFTIKILFFYFFGSQCTNSHFI